MTTKKPRAKVKDHQAEQRTYSAGVDPTVSYPVNDFLIVARLSRARLAYAKRRAREMGIDLVRDTGTPTVLGKDWIAYCERCKAYTTVRGRPRQSKESTAGNATST